MNEQIDQSIPELTEVIELEVEEEDFDSTIGQNEGNRLSEEEWQRMENTLKEAVLKQVLARIDFVLEHRVRDSLADVLQTAVENLAQEIRGGLHNTLEEVITRAVTQEVHKARNTK